MSVVAGMSNPGGLTDAPSDVTPNPLNWANVPSGVSPQSNADQTISGLSPGVSITLRATLSAGTYGAGIKSFNVYKNSVLNGSVTPANGATLDVTVQNGDTVHYEDTKGGTSGTAWDATTNVTNITDGGAAIDTFTNLSVTAP